MSIEKMNSEKIHNKMTLRNMLVTEKNIPESKKWLLETPKVIRQQAVFRAVSNMKTNITNLKQRNISHFKFQKKKTGLWSMGIEKQLSLSDSGELSMFKSKPFNFGTFYSRDKLIKQMSKYKGTEKFPFEHQENGTWKPKADSVIQKDRYNRYYLIIPVTVPAEPSPKPEKIVSIDPGLRKFLSTYSPDGECSLLGVDCRDRFWKMTQRLDNIDSLMVYASPKERKKMRRTKCALYRKMSDLKRELHDKTINHLTNKYTTIILGNINVKELVNIEKRILRIKEVRSILKLAHGEFRTKLALKCKSKGLTLMLVNEAWTSKTCTSCGHVNRNLGASEVYNCPCCGMVLDRDLNGARNILIRTMDELVVRK